MSDFQVTMIKMLCKTKIHIWLAVPSPSVV